MSTSIETSHAEPRGSLFAAWEAAFTAPVTWRESFVSGIEAVVRLLEQDRRVVDTCVLAYLPVTTGGSLVWHREIVRSRITEIMHDKWIACGGRIVPRMHFEVLLGEACTLLRDRLRTGASFADLPAEILSLWGREAPDLAHV